VRTRDASSPPQPLTRGPIRIALADSHTLFRAGLRKLLAAQRDFDVVGEAGSAAETLGLIETHPMDLLLLDLNLPGAGGLDLLREITLRQVPARTLLLTASDNEEQLAQAMKLGACGVVLKTTATDQLLQAIHKVLAGEVWLDPKVTATVVRHLAEGRGSEGRGRDTPGGLTPREREIAALVGQGYRYREIAAMLSISEQTVKNHLRNMFQKLGVSDRLQLALYAIHHNL